MTDISNELIELDENLYKAEAELDKDFNDFIQTLLLALLLRVRSFPKSQKEIRSAVKVDSVFKNDLEKLYTDYFKKISELAESATKAELLSLASTNAQRRRIEGIRIRQDTYNRRYASKLAGKQAEDLERILRNSVITHLNENPDTSIGELRNVIRNKTKDFTKSRGSITAETEANRVTNQVRLEAFRKSGVIKAVRFTAVLDKRTTVMCRTRHGTIIPLKSTQLPSYTPPLHPRCRSYLIPIDVTDPADVADFQELKEIDNESPVTPTAKVVDSW